MPLLLFGLGISGAWIANLTQLAPYLPYFIAATVACLGGGYWLVYRSGKRACADGDACARPLSNRIVKTGLVFATILVIGALGLDFLAPLFFIEIGPPIDTFGGASGESKARLFEVFGYAFLASRPR